MASPLLLITLLLTAVSPSSVAAAENSSDFIRRSCSVTLYSKLCYNSLKPYESTVRHSPLLLAIAAANVSLSKIKNASLEAAELRRGSLGKVSAALRDCAEVLRTAAELTNQAGAEIQKLGPAAQSGGPSFAWDASNAQTWMSAALTNEDTCVEGFSDAGGGSGEGFKAFVDKVGRVEQYTSNALALLNALVDG